MIQNKNSAKTYTQSIELIYSELLDKNNFNIYVLIHGRRTRIRWKYTISEDQHFMEKDTIVDLKGTYNGVAGDNLATKEVTLVYSHKKKSNDGILLIIILCG